MKKFSFTFTLLILAIVTIVLAFYMKKSSDSEEQKSEQIDNIETEEIIEKVPEFKTEIILDNLNNPWDIGFIDSDTFIFTLKEGEIKLFNNSEIKSVGVISDVVSKGEGGLLGLAIDSDFSNNNYIYLCFNSSIENLDVRVARFKLNIEEVNLTDRKDIVTGMPANASGRHSGCQLEFADDVLWIGTGDAAMEKNPQDPKSLGGKILRVDRDGNSVLGNLSGEFDPRIFSYGHRNIQGIVLFLNDEFGLKGLSAEHGSDRNDEVNKLIPGNFGWDPNPNYTENVPMTDLDKFPEAIKSIWSSGYPTIATSGITLIKGDQWGIYNKSIAFANLKSEKIVVLRLDGNLNIIETKELLNNQFGRLRTIQMSPDGNLYILTSNAKNNDKIIKVSAD
jgi:glucose/arabinose dehydrogenase